jgi:hypothetical protein
MKAAHAAAANRFAICSFRMDILPLSYYKFLKGYKHVSYQRGKYVFLKGNDFYQTWWCKYYRQLIVKIPTLGGTEG